MKNTKLQRQTTKKKKVLRDDCAERGLKVETDFLQFGKKIKTVAHIVHVGKPKKICQNKTYDILLQAMKLISYYLILIKHLFKNNFFLTSL